MNLLETYTCNGATLKLYRCPTCKGHGDLRLEGEYGLCPTCGSDGVVECCVDCGRTFSVEGIDPDNFEAGELYTDEAGRCWQCANDRFCAEIAAYPYTPEELLEADYRRDEEMEHRRSA